MIVRFATPGTSFKNRHDYLFRDPKMGMKSDRVEYTATRNVITDDTAVASRIMAHTARNQKAIKKAYGTDLRGRKLKSFVIHYSLSWRIGDDPTVEEMVQEADETIKALGAGEYQAYIIVHNDQTHKHLHVVINRVHPVTGIALKMGRNYRKLSRRASDYERQHGIQCKQREKNRARLEELATLRQQNPAAAKGRMVRARDLNIQEAWNQTDNGQSFAAALADKGYVLARGERKRKDGRVCRYVVIDPYGKIVNIAKHIEGENGKNIRVATLREHLADLDPETLPLASIARLDREELLDEGKAEKRALLYKSQRAEMARKGHKPAPISDHYNAQAAPQKSTQQSRSGNGDGEELQLPFPSRQTRNSRNIAAFMAQASPAPPTSNDNRPAIRSNFIQQAQGPPEVSAAIKPQQRHNQHDRETGPGLPL